MLTHEGFYDGLTFHRVIDGFMAQTGDPTGTGSGGSKYPDLPAEFNSTNFGRGVVGMARTSNPNSANSQFFICFNDCSFLNGQYTVWGQVTEGMDVVDKITRGEPPANPDKIVKMMIASEADATASAAAPTAPAPAEATPAAPAPANESVPPANTEPASGAEDAAAAH
jgi:peptidylprolyl isomerase